MGSATVLGTPWLTERGGQAHRELRARAMERGWGRDGAAAPGSGCGRPPPGGQGAGDASRVSGQGRPQTDPGGMQRRPLIPPASPPPGASSPPGPQPSVGVGVGGLDLWV